MSVADTIQELATDISIAYDEVQTKGGTLPQNKNTNNLATAIGTIPTGITPTGTINITENGTYDVTDYASASVAVNEIKTETVTKTLTAEATSISFSHTLGVAPKAIELWNENEGTTMQSGEVRKVFFIGQGGAGYRNNRINGQNTWVTFSLSGDAISVGKVILGDSTVTISRAGSNTYFLANIEYSLTAYWWEDDE